ncbi:MAG TPA: hypothetical protein VFF63_02095, partial [Candidatus Babeliales bacterium]|nr:hypothetical protein [Candidatus Babeliales bacterium]
YPRVDFMLRSHSPAWSYPTRYTFEDLADRLPVDSETYMEAFVSAAQQLRPRYAVPFASGICHLHREVRDENRFLVTAAEMRGYFESNASRVPNTKLVVMPAGSSWSSQRGFELTDNAVDDVVAYAEARAATQAERLEETYRSEDAKQVAYADFSAYFENFFRATRWLRPLACGARWVFAIERPAEFWTLDFGKASIEAGTQMPDRYDSVIKVSPAVLSGGLRNGVFTNIDIAKRWRVHVKRDRAMRHFVIANLLLLYEAEYLSPRRLLSWRFLSGYARRLPEIVDYALMALRTVSKGKESIVTAVTSIAEG